MEGIGFLLMLFGIVIGIVWLFFPFLVCSRLTNIHTMLIKNNAELQRMNVSLNQIILETYGTKMNTQELADFFKGRKVEFEQEQSE